MRPEGEAQAHATIIAPAAGFIARQGLAWLEQASGERRYVQSELRIGRSDQNDLRLNDASVSRYHAFLRRVDGRYLLSDVGSQNGTFVNGRRVHAPSELRSGDRIRAGTTELTFHVDTPADLPGGGSDDSSTTLTSASTFPGTLLEEYVQGELRIVTVLFLDLHGFTAMSERMAPDEVTQIMNRCFERLTATVGRFAGYVDKYVGDAMMVLFGAPVAHADDPERAVRAALALQDELARFNQHQRANVKLQMRIGINTGEVLAGRIGAGEYGQYTVMGDAVNLASRLEHAARVGHILVGETTHRFTRHVIRYVALPPMSIRGKAEPVQTYEVVGIHSQTTAVGATIDSAFVGRKRELQRLGDLIKTSPHGFQSASIVAPAGAGKSSLLTELHRRHAADARWAVARCSEYDRASPFMALRQLIVQILRSSGRGVEVLQSASDTSGGPLAVLGQLLSPNVERAPGALPDARRHSLIRAFAQLVTEHAVRECLVLAIDSVQWIDAESLSVVDAVLPDFEDARIVLITTARPEWGHSWPNEVLSMRLERFSRQECAQLVALLLRAEAVDTATLELLTRESDGNPLLLAEMVRSAAESGSLCEQHGEWRLLDPESAVTGRGVDSLRSIIQARLDVLSPEERRVLQVAAVLGQSWTGSLLARVLDDNLPVPDLLRSLAEREYLIEEMGGEEPGYSFAHTSMQEVVYASLPHTGRERLHERVGRVLEEQFDPVRPNKAALRELVHHFMRGSSPHRAAQYLLYAADAGAGIAEDDWAIATYRRALEFAQKTRDRVRRRALELDIQEHLGDALLRQSTLADAQVAYEAAGELDDSHQRTGRLKARLAHVAGRQGNHARVLALVRGALQGADIEPAARVLLEAHAGLSLCALGRLHEADEHITRARALTAGTPEGEGLQLALIASGTLQFLRGELRQARALLERADAVRGSAVASEATSELRIMLARASYALGDVDAAMRSLDETLREPRDSWSYAVAEVLSGRVLMERGVIERGRSLVDDALARAQRIGAREVALQARLGTARAALSAARPAEAIELARSVIAAAEAVHQDPLVCEGQAVLSAALVQSGSAVEAAELAREAVVHARTLRLPLHEAVARRALGLALVRTGDVVQGRRHLDAASAAFEQMGARVEWARTLLAGVEVDASTRDIADAGPLRERLMQLIELLTSLRLDGDRALALDIGARLSN
jgi:adenylate cyclase